MIKLTNSLNAWNTPEFEQILKNEIEKLDPAQLPLQQGLAQSSYVSDEKFSITIMNVSESENDIHIKTGVFYSGIIAGSCCSDDPTPVCTETEYCDLLFVIDKTNAEATVTLLKS